MILDRLENADLYRGLGNNIAVALDYLRQTDFSKVPTRRHEIDGDRVFAIVQRYQPKPFSQMVWEAHRKYTDIQFVVAGAERMGYAPLSDKLSVRQDYSDEKDAILFDAKGQFFNVCAGDFAIFTPTDVHAPCLATDLPDAAAEVFKVVVKCRVE
jgi:biofilm protein TabA